MSLKFTVLGFHSDSGKIFCEHVNASTGMNAFKKCVDNLGPCIECVAAIPGHLYEERGVHLPGSAVVDGETIEVQPDVFGE